MLEVIKTLCVCAQTFYCVYCKEGVKSYYLKRHECTETVYFELLVYYFKMVKFSYLLYIGQLVCQ